jgi:HD superfamily phosphohydrolase
MTSYKEVHAAYLETDGYLAGRESAARSPSRQKKWATLRRYNDHAYYVMHFAQLEQHVNDQCEKLIARRQAKPKWASRRPWDSLDVDRMDFMRRVAVLTDKGQATYARVKSYYKIRNDIAHGDSAAVGPMVLPVVAAELRKLASAMKAS